MDFEIKMMTANSDTSAILRERSARKPALNYFLSSTLSALCISVAGKSGKSISLRAQIMSVRESILPSILCSPPKT